MCVVDILIHVNGKFDGSQKAELIERLRKVPGVVDPIHKCSKGHFMFVAYDTELTRSLNLLTTVKSLGYRAEIVAI
jgi:hypothetical protein